MSQAPALDPRIHAFRPDLADATLRGVVQAMRFVTPTIKHCVRGVVPLLAEPSFEARQVSQIRYGEFLDVFETRADGISWVQSRTDRYVGYIPTEGVLDDTISDLSHRIHVLRTFVYSEPDLKSPPLDELTLGSHVHPLETTNTFTELASGGYVFAEHIVPAEELLLDDYVFTAGRLLGVPYLWGGRTPKGLDCSGFTQLALEIAGIDTPRDTDQQCEAFGKPLPCHWRDMPWRRGDIVFFKPPGIGSAPHLGFMTGPDHMIHANGTAMAVTVEPLFDVVMRGAEINAMGRPRD